MASSQKDKLTSQDLSDLQAKIVKEFKRRANPGSGESLASFATTVEEYTLSDETKSKISASDANKILKAFQVLVQGKNVNNITNIISNGTKAEIATLTNASASLDTYANYEKKADTLAKTGCVGGCQGLCYVGCYGGCSGGCYEECANGCQAGCKGRCSNTCNDGCGGGCKDSCVNDCKGCTATCYGACQNACGSGSVSGAFVPNGNTGCADNCTSYCGNGCKTTCNLSCHSGCEGTCNDSCGTDCGTSCDTGCKTTCTGVAGFTVSS